MIAAPAHEYDASQGPTTPTVEAYVPAAVPEGYAPAPSGDSYVRNEVRGYFQNVQSRSASESASRRAREMAALCAAAKANAAGHSVTHTLVVTTLGVHRS